jgi:hypothetical protein
MATAPGRCPGLRDVNNVSSSVGPDFVKSLQNAVTAQQRLCTLQNLLHHLQYDSITRTCQCPPTIFSQAFQMDTIKILCLHVASCLRGPPRNSTRQQVLEFLLRVLEVAYRYSPDLTHREESIQHQGKEVLYLLPIVYQQANITNQIEGAIDGQNSSSVTMVLMLILSIWHLYSSSSLGSSLLLQRPDTLPILNEVLSRKQDTSNTNTSIVLDGLGLLKNLTYFGEDHRCRIVDQADLIITAANLSRSPNDKALERLSAVIRNLALSTEVRTKLAQRPEILTALVSIAGRSFHPLEGHGDNSTKHTLRNVTSALSSLAMDIKSTNLLLFHGDGILIRQITKFLTHPDDAVVRKRAAKTFRLLARETASVSPMSILLQNEQLLTILSNRAMYDFNDGVRLEAQEAFAKCATLIRSPMAQFQNVLDTLTHMAIKTTGEVTPSMDMVTWALREQACHFENRVSMGHHNVLTEGLAKILSTPTASLVAKENASSTLLDLSKEPSNHIFLTIPSILENMVQTLMDQRAGANEIASTRTRIRESIVRFLLNLSETPANWKTMASQTSLLQSLLQFAASRSTDAELKKQVKEVILRLASEL